MFSAALINLLVIGPQFTVIAFAATFGKQAERTGAVFLVASMVATWIAQMLAGTSPLIAFMVIDLVLALGFGFLTFRYPDKLWPGLAGCAQLLVFVFSATRAIDFPMSETTWLIAMNFSCFAVAAALAGGTWASRWHRRRPSEWDLAAAR